MKQIVLPNRELQILSEQLQSYKQGYTIAQIRALDKCVRTMEEVLKPYLDLVKKLGDELKNEKDQEIIQEKLNKFQEEESDKKVFVSFEDSDFEFVKKIWQSMNGLSGNDGARKSIIIIDDSIQDAKEPVFTQN